MHNDTGPWKQRSLIDKMIFLKNGIRKCYILGTEGPLRPSDL